MMARFGSLSRFMDYSCAIWMDYIVHVPNGEGFDPPRTIPFEHAATRGQEG